MDEAKDIPKRVQIIPLGYEIDKIVIPALEREAERVYLIKNRGKETAINYFKVIMEKFKTEGVTVVDGEICECNIFDINDALKTYAEIIGKELGNNIQINISTGPEAMCAAGAIASFLFDVKAFFVKPKMYLNQKEPYSEKVVPLSEGYEDSITIPSFFNQKALDIELVMYVCAANKYFGFYSFEQKEIFIKVSELEFSKSFPQNFKEQYRNFLDIQKRYKEYLEKDSKHIYNKVKENLTILERLGYLIFQKKKRYRLSDKGITAAGIFGSYYGIVF